MYHQFWKAQKNKKNNLLAKLEWLILWQILLINNHKIFSILLSKISKLKILKAKIINNLNKIFKVEII